MLDIEGIREQYPALERRVGGQPVIYADNPGGTQVPQLVADAVADYLLHRNANVHGPFVTSRLTDETIDGAREAMADLLNAPSSDEIVFGPNMTTLTFQMMHAIARTLRTGDEVVVTRLDHDANYTPWVTLAEHGATIRQVQIHTADVTLDLQQFEQVLSRRTRIVAVGHGSNATGTVNPIREIVAMVRRRSPNAMIFVDAVQSVPHLPVDVQSLGCDMLVCSAYKFFGPHAGILWGRQELLEQIPAYKVRPAGALPPDKFEPGTKVHEALAGITAAVNYLASLAPEWKESRRARLRAAMQAVQRYEQTLAEALIRGLLTIPGLHLYGITDPARLAERVPTVAVTLDGQRPDALARRLADEGIFCWSGHYYALEVIEALGLAPHGALRLGLAHYNTLDEVGRIVETLGGYGMME